jgi:hypothetical protein
MDADAQAQQLVSSRSSTHSRPSTQPTNDATPVTPASPEMGGEGDSSVLEQPAVVRCQSTSRTSASAPVAGHMPPLGAKNSVQHSVPTAGRPKRSVVVAEDDEEDDSIVLKRPPLKRPQRAAGPQRGGETTTIAAAAFGAVAGSAPQHGDAPIGTSGSPDQTEGHHRTGVAQRPPPALGPQSRRCGEYSGCR